MGPVFCAWFVDSDRVHFVHICYLSAMQLIEEKHPPWYHDIPCMKTLILGSFPPHRDKWDYPFYYPNSQNRFWGILAQLAELPLQHTKHDPSASVAERKAIMERLCVGIQNIGARIRRKGKSSLDTDIEIIGFQDILANIRRHPELRRILLPGYSAKHSTYSGFMRYLTENGIAVPRIKPAPNAQFTILVDGRHIECVVLNSTSTASLVSREVVLEQFRTHIV